MITSTSNAKVKRLVNLRKKRKARIKCDSWSVKGFNRTKCITANERAVHG